LRQPPCRTDPGLRRVGKEKKKSMSSVDTVTFLAPRITCFAFN
jgi:hypothetical protein